MYVHKHERKRVRMKCERERERVSALECKQPIVLRRSKAECDREGLHTPFFLYSFKAASHSAPFCLAVHENYIIKDIWHIRGYIHCSELIIKKQTNTRTAAFGRTNMTRHTKRKKPVKIFCKKHR